MMSALRCHRSAAALLALLGLLAGCLFAQGAATVAPPPKFAPRLTPSPVELFRMLLGTNAAGREAWLGTRPASSRAAIEAKLREYEAMAPEQRNQKLRASQISWYLPPLMNMPATNRAAVLAAIPEEDRKVIEMRLGQLSILPPPMLNQIVTNQSVLRMFDAGQKTGSNLLVGVSPDQRRLAEQVYQVWKKLLELPVEARGRPLSKLTVTDRSNMEMTLGKFSRLAPEERAQALAGFRKFAELSASEREAFLNSAQRWQSMNEDDREMWRKVASSLQRPPATMPLPLPRRVERPEPVILLGTNG